MSNARQAAQPFVKKHIDGHVLVRRDGQMVWLNWSERIRYALGLVTAEGLERSIGDPRRRM
jgi:hypothetical protein